MTGGSLRACVWTEDRSLRVRVEGAGSVAGVVTQALILVRMCGLLRRRDCRSGRKNIRAWLRDQDLHDQDLHDQDLRGQESLGAQWREVPICF